MKTIFITFLSSAFLILFNVNSLFSQCTLNGGSYTQDDLIGPTGCLTECTINCTITIQNGIVALNGNWNLSSFGNVTIEIALNGGLIFGNGETLKLTEGSNIIINQSGSRSQPAFSLESGASTSEVKIDKGPNNSFDGDDFTTLNAEDEVLPVSLTFFEAFEKISSISLTWQTSTELNNAKFIIETTAQGEVFQPLGEVAGAGTTTEPQNYSFTHHTPSAGINYYRLKQVDFDGTFEYSKVIAIEAAGSQDILVFPNPARDKITLQYDQSKGAGNIQLLDGLGRRIQARITGYAGNYDVTLPESLARGTYWLKVERGGKVQTLPVVKE